jgi:phosphoribosyl 1,2-cyclic phosphodiesterase
VRGSIPVPGPTTLRSGGNTSCVEVHGADDECLIFDAGTGIRALGLELLRRKMPPPPVHLFISHTHWDHIQGFPFFTPCYLRLAEIRVRGPVHFVEEKPLRDVFDEQMRYEFFPISNRQLAANIVYEAVGEAQWSVGRLKIRSQFTNHTIRSLGYRVEENERSAVYTGDHEPYFNLFAADQARKSAGDTMLFDEAEAAVREAEARFTEFLRDADVLIADSSYTPEEYRRGKRNWGHAHWGYWLEVMKKANVKRLFLTHHEPVRNDEELERVLADVRRAATNMGLNGDQIALAKEGEEWDV